MPFVHVQLIMSVVDDHIEGEWCQKCLISKVYTGFTLCRSVFMTENSISELIENLSILKGKISLVTGLLIIIPSTISHGG